MKKLTEIVNPFILVLVPVLVAVVIGMSYQFQQEVHSATASLQATEHAVPLFYKGLNLIKAVCAVNPQKVW